MINENELRIGNLILRDERYVRVIQVRGNNFTRIEFLDKSFTENHIMFDLQFAEPIPLTEEILLKCGFEQVESIEAKTKYAYEIEWWGRVAILNGELVPDEYYFLSGLTTSIKYLHELQNLFYSLTNKELEIEL